MWRKDIIFVCKLTFTYMGKEIERKFLVVDESFKSLATSSGRISQGYLSDNPDRVVRVRIYGDRGYLTVKSRNVGAERKEWEFEIPADEAAEMLAICCRVVEKTRYIVPADNGLKWEVDVFGGRNEGLVVAEIELPAPDTRFERPSFVGEEVTGNPAYYNSNL